MAQAECGDVVVGRRPVSGAALLSAIVHGLAVLALVAFQAAPRPEIEAPPPLTVDLVLETPPPPAVPSPPQPVSAPVATAMPPGPARATPPSPVRAMPPRAMPPRAMPVARRMAPMPKPTPLVDTRPAPAPESPGTTKIEAARAEPAESAAPAASAAVLPAPPAAVPPAPPAAIVAVDYHAYVGRLHELIARHRVYPPQALRRHEEGDVRLRVMLAGDGSVVDILNLAEAPSALTRAARQAVESAAPFGPPPGTAGGERQLAFDVTVAFRLR